MEKNNKVDMDVLKFHWYQINERLINSGEVVKETGDITQIFFKGLYQKLIKKEPIKIIVKGTTGKGKSTVGLFIKNKINLMIKDLEEKGLSINGKKSSYKDENKDEFELIASNQIEFSRIARREELFQVCAQIDEFSDMSTTGLNSSIEKNFLAWYNKVCAQKYIHRIYCTPNNDYDDQADLILEVIDVNKPNKLTKLKVIYYNLEIGIITVNVKDILEKEWYDKYLQKKFFAMNLMLKSTIRDIRELEFALVKMIVYKLLKPLAESAYMDKSLVKNKIKVASKEVGAVHSIIGESELSSQTEAILQLVVSKGKNVRELYKNRKVQLNENQKEFFENNVEMYQKEIENEEKEAINLIQLYIEYMSIGSNEIPKKVIEICKKYDINVEVQK
jgi:hypothetical protein